MKSTEYAMHEFEILGWPGDDNFQKAVCEAVTALLDVFSKQGHSGMSATEVISLFVALAQQKPISPLTGKAEEWSDVSKQSGYPLWQNKRCSEVFMDANGEAYWVNGVIFEDPDGSRYTNRRSHVSVEFPWSMPTPRVVKRRRVPRQTQEMPQ